MPCLHSLRSTGCSRPPTSSSWTESHSDAGKSRGWMSAERLLEPPDVAVALDRCGGNRHHRFADVEFPGGGPFTLAEGWSQQRGGRQPATTSRCSRPGTHLDKTMRRTVLSKTLSIDLAPAWQM